MASKSIGSLYIDIVARTAQLSVDLEKVKQQVSGAKGDINDTGDAIGKGFGDIAASKVLQFGFALAGARSAVRLLAREIKDVVTNVEDIPGLDPVVVTSIEDLRHAIVGSGGAMDWLKETTAETLSFFEHLGVAATHLFDVLKQGRQNGTTPTSGQLEDTVLRAFAGTYDKQLSPTDIERDRDPKRYDKNLASAKQRGKDIEAGNATNGLTGSDKAEADYQKYLGIFEEMKTAKQDDLTQQLLLNKAEEQYGKVISDTAAIDREAGKLQQENAEVLLARQDMFATKQVKLQDLKEREVDVERQLAALVGEDGKIAVADGNREIALLQEKLKLNKEINVAMQQAGDFSKKMGDQLSSDILSAVEEGKSLHSLFQTLIQDLEKLILKQFVEQQLSQAISTIGMAVMGMFADGGRPPVGKVSMVGERGPELFLPDAAQRTPGDTPVDKQSSGSHVSMVGMGGPQLFIPEVSGTIIPNKDLGNTKKPLDSITVPPQDPKAQTNQVQIIGKAGPQLFVPEVPGTIIPNKDLGKDRQSEISGFFADGGSPPVGQPAVVGEAGIEAFVPDNLDTSSGGGSGGSGGGAKAQFFIDARGADRSGLQALAQKIIQVNGSIEYRAVAAVFNAQRRGA